MRVVLMVLYEAAQKDGNQEEVFDIVG